LIPADLDFYEGKGKAKDQSCPQAVWNVLSSTFLVTK
jgi:hypothetical protein